MKKNILLGLGKLTLVLWPLQISRGIKKLYNIVLSCRFSVSVNTNYFCFVHSPFYMIGNEYITIGKNFYAGPGLRIECFDEYQGTSYFPCIIIGENVCFNYNCHIGAINKIVIGNNVLIGSGVLITDHSHGKNDSLEMSIPPAVRTLYSKGPVVIEDNVWIGEGVSILPNVTIGKNSVIGANTVVTKDIPAYSVVAGNPYKILKSY